MVNECGDDARQTSVHVNRSCVHGTCIHTHTFVKYVFVYLFVCMHQRKRVVFTILVCVCVCVFMKVTAAAVPLVHNANIDNVKRE
jgi:hypothetical protein